MDFLLTKFMYPLKDKLPILDGYYFDNPRTTKEIKYVEQLIRKSTPFPPTDKQAGGEGYITLNHIINCFNDKYSNDEYVSDFVCNNKYTDPCYKIASMWVILRLKKIEIGEHERTLEIAKNLIDTITLLSFDINNYVNFSIITSQEYYENEE